MKEYHRTEGSVARRFKNDRVFRFLYFVYREMRLLPS